MWILSFAIAVSLSVLGDFGTRNEQKILSRVFVASEMICVKVFRETDERTTHTNQCVPYHNDFGDHFDSICIEITTAHSFCLTIQLPVLRSDCTKSLWNWYWQSLQHSVIERCCALGENKRNSNLHLRWRYQSPNMDTTNQSPICVCAFQSWSQRTLAGWLAGCFSKQPLL